MKKRAPKSNLRRSKKKIVNTDPKAQRLNKVLAAAGLGSRREVEELIVEGRVEIDKEVVTDLGRRVDPQAVTIKVDGVAVKKFHPVYYALNKPPGVLSTNRDPSGRMRVIDLVPDGHRVFSVGRLDKSSEGLILLTNDGELAQRLAHPRFKVQKSYFVVVAGNLTTEELEKLRKGVYLAEGVARIDGARIRKHRKGCTELEIVLSEGKNREIRRILARAGHKVVLLRRIAIGPLKLGLLPTGASRQLTTQEIKALYAATSAESVKLRRKMDRPRKPSTTVETASDNELEVTMNGGRDASDRLPRSLQQKFEMEDFSAEDEFEEDFGEESLGSWSAEPEGDVFGGFEDFDDDFVGGFSGKSGSVLSFDDEENDSSRSTDRRRKSSSGQGNRSAKKSTGPRTGRGNAARADAREGGTTRRSAKKGAKLKRPRVGTPRPAPARDSERPTVSRKATSGRPVKGASSRKKATDRNPAAGRSSKGFGKPKGKRPGRDRS